MSNSLFRRAANVLLIGIDLHMRRRADYLAAYLLIIVARVVPKPKCKLGKS